MTIRICKCGAGFLVAGRNHKWCSWECRYKHVGKADNLKQRKKRRDKKCQSNRSEKE